MLLKLVIDVAESSGLSLFTMPWLSFRSLKASPIHRVDLSDSQPMIVASSQSMK